MGMISMNNQQSSRQGIALIVVLGLLSILVITGVAFSVAMRTERSATRAYMDIVKARHLAQTALYRVIGGELNTLIPPTTPYPLWNAYSPLEGDIAMLYDRLADSPAKFIPMHLRYDINENDLDYTDWIELRDPMNNAFYGEFAYLIVNNSGLLDANVIGAYEPTNPGDPPARRYGYDPGEIRFSPTILDGVLNSSLRSYRNAFRRFDSLPELYRLCTPTNFYGQIGALPLKHLGHPPQTGDLPNWLRGGFANDLHVFSRYPRGYADNNMRAVTNVAYIGGPTNEWDSDIIIADALADMTPNPMPNLQDFIAVLKDYVSEPYVPGDGNLQRISSKPVPMINEIIVSNRLELTDLGPGSGHRLRHIVFVTIETWYPFPEAGPDQFRVIFEDAPGATPTVGFTIPPYPNLSGAYQPMPGFESQPFAPTPNSYHLTTLAFFADQQVNNPGGFPFPPGSSIPFETSYELNHPIRVVYDGTGQPTVDRISANWPAGMFFLNAQRSVNVESPASLGITGVSANDPRLNWDAGNNLHWRGSTPTPGEINLRVAAESGEYGYELDEVGRMFSARERGELLSVGEVGYLLYDATKPWTTIRLLEPDPNNTARIIDRLTIHPEPYRRGMVNLNTQHTNALRAAFWTMPIDAYPTDPPPPASSDRLTQAMTDQVVAQIMSVTRANPVLNLSELKDLLPQAFVDGLLNTVDDKFKRESLVRNSLGVLGTRHNLFTVFLAARTFAPSYNPADQEHKDNREDFVTAEQRAIVVVWRDPFITTDQANNPTRKSLVQYFHWLTDEDEL